MSEDEHYTMDLNILLDVREHLVEHSGYIYNKEYEMGEHRVVAMLALAKRNRGFVGDDEVHHIDTDKKNNKPTNLMVLSRTAHILVHCALRSCIFESAGYSYKSLITPNGLIKFLKDARISFTYVGDFVESET